MRVALFSANRLLVMALAVIVMASSLHLASAQPAAKSSLEREPFLSAKRFAQEKNYPEVWNVLWTAAKAGDPAALPYLVLTITMAGLIPPGVSQDDEDENRKLGLALMVYAADSEADSLPAEIRPFRKALIALLQTHTGFRYENGIAAPRCVRPDDRLQGCPAKSNPPLPFPIENRIALARCYLNEPTGKGCLEKAIALGIVEPFADFAAKFDKQAIESGIPPRCTAGPHTMCYDARIDEPEPK